MREDRGSWYLFTGLVIGIILGLIYAWIIAPVQYVDTEPVTLRADLKDTYRLTIAQSYAVTGDLARAQARLALLGDEDSAQALAEQAQRAHADGAPGDSQTLAVLAAALGEIPLVVPPSPVMETTQSPTASPTLTLSPTASNTPTPEFTATSTATITPTATLTPTLGPSSTPTRTPRATATLKPTRTPLPSITPTPTLAPPFVLDNQIQVCNPDLGEPQIQIFLNNAAGQGVPGVEILITWAAGQESIFTGLKPEIDLGYADFVMSPETIYTLQITGGGQIIPDLNIPACEDDAGERYAGSWRLIFKHP